MFALGQSKSVRGILALHRSIDLVLVCRATLVRESEPHRVALRRRTAASLAWVTVDCANHRGPPPMFDFNAVDGSSTGT
jgi:hypothetical protein